MNILAAPTFLLFHSHVHDVRKTLFVVFTHCYIRSFILVCLSLYNMHFALPWSAGFDAPVMRLITVIASYSQDVLQSTFLVHDEENIMTPV